MRLKFFLLLSLSIFVHANFASQPCWFAQSCLKLANHYCQAVTISCNYLEAVEAQGNAQGSTQLDLSYGDSLGAPEPRELYCVLTYANQSLKYNFDFYNPYWGSIIEFNLLTERNLNVLVNNPWGPQKTAYTFNW